MSYFDPSPLVYFSTIVMNLTSTSPTYSMGTTGSKMNFFPVGCLIQILNSSGIPTTRATVKVGTNSPNDNNIVTSTSSGQFSVSNQSTSNTYTILPIQNGSVIVPPATLIIAAVNGAAAIPGGILTAKMILWGFYF